MSTRIEPPYTGKPTYSEGSAGTSEGPFAIAQFQSLQPRTPKHGTSRCGLGPIPIYIINIILMLKLIRE